MRSKVSGAERADDEWPAVDAQREGADFILTPGAGHP